MRKKGFVSSSLVAQLSAGIVDKNIFLFPETDLVIVSVFQDGVG